MEGSALGQDIPKEEPTLDFPLTLYLCETL